MFTKPRMLLAVCTTLLLVPIADGSGFLAGLRPGTVTDRVITTVAVVLDSRER